VEDDGRGFDPDVAPAAVRNGLQNMAKRLREVGGTFEIQSAPGKGTRVVFKVPMALTRRLAP